MNQNLTAGARVFNVKAIKANLMREARAALEMSLEQTLRDAREHAPVRDVFAGASHGRSGLVPVGAGRWSKARRGSALLVAERGTKVIRRKAEDQKAFMEAVREQRWTRHRYELLETNRFGSPTGRVQRFTTSPRDFDPVLRDISGDLRRPSGGFRDVTGIRAEEGRISLPFRAMAGVPELLEPATGRRSRPEAAPLDTIENFLSAKGLNELKRGLGKNSALHITKLGETTLGGRLRDEIYRTGVRDTGQTISGWVVSPTPYAKYQEYGTSRHRPQPYMRPALYRAREHLPRLVKAHLGRKFR